MRVGGRRGFPHLFIRRVRPRHPDVLCNGPVKQVGVLEHDADLILQGAEGIPADIGPVERDRPSGHIIKPQHQRQDRRLAGAGRPDDRGRAPGRYRKCDAVKDFLLAARIGEADRVEPDLREWEEMVYRIKHLEKKVTIGLVGKYIRLHDAYLSVAEALHHAGYANSAEVEIRWIDSEEITPENVGEILQGCDGILVPGGFGNRGIEGMITTAQYCRENNVPYLGICLGMQIAVIEFARHVCGIADADSGEFAPDGKNKVIDFLPDQNDEVDKGGTLRLGSYPCVLKEGTVIRKWYGADTIRERHRHRYEFNNDYRDVMEKNGMTLSGQSPDWVIVETVELPDHDFFVGVQFHPEFRSRPNRPHPLFLGLLHASISHGKKV